MSHTPLSKDESCHVYFSVPYSEQDADLGMHTLTVKSNSTVSVGPSVYFYHADKNGVLVVHDKDDNEISQVTIEQGDAVQLKLKNIGPFPIDQLAFHTGEITGISVSGSCAQDSVQLLSGGSCDLVVKSTNDAVSSESEPTNYKIRSNDLAPHDFFLPIYVHEKMTYS